MMVMKVKCTEKWFEFTFKRYRFYNNFVVIKMFLDEQGSGKLIIRNNSLIAKPVWCLITRFKGVSSRCWLYSVWNLTRDPSSLFSQAVIIRSKLAWPVAFIYNYCLRMSCKPPYKNVHPAATNASLGVGEEYLFIHKSFYKRHP